MKIEKKKIQKKKRKKGERKKRRDDNIKIYIAI